MDTGAGESNLSAKQKYPCVGGGRLRKNSGFGRAYYYDADKRRTANQCGRTSYRDIYGSGSFGDERKDFVGN